MIEIIKAKNIKILTWVIIFSISNIISIKSMAISDFYNKSQEGWFWYKDKPKDLDEDDEKKKTKAESSKPEQKTYIPPSKMEVPKDLTPEKARKFIEDFKVAMEDTRNMWLLTSDPKHAAELLRSQERVFAFSTSGAKSLESARRMDPEINEEIKNPMSNVAKRLKESEQFKREEILISEYAKDFEIIYFADPNCPACKAFTPILEEFVIRYGFKAKMIDSTSGVNTEKRSAGNKIDTKIGAKDGLFELKTDRELLRKVSPKYLPTLIAFDATTGEYQNISAGLVSGADLRKHILILIRDIVIGVTASSKDNQVTEVGEK